LTVSISLQPSVTGSYAVTIAGFDAGSVVGFVACSDASSNGDSIVVADFVTVQVSIAVVISVIVAVFVADAIFVAVVIILREYLLSDLFLDVLYAP